MVRLIAESAGKSRWPDKPSRTIAGCESKTCPTEPQGFHPQIIAGASFDRANHTVYIKPCERLQTSDFTVVVVIAILPVIVAVAVT